MPRKKAAILAQVRMNRIMDIVSSEGNCTVMELSRLFDVSPATVRNDLHKLESEGCLKRTFGGAISSATANFELTAREKIVRNVEEKCSIAQKASEMIHDGETIALDTGTTMLELARKIVNIHDLTIVTTDLQIAAFLEEYSNAHILLIGGSIRRQHHCTFGQYSIDSIKKLHVDKAFLAANGVTLERGASTPNIELAAIKWQMMDIADKAYLLFDTSKIGKNSLAHIAMLEEFDLIITDSRVSQSFLTQAIQTGINVLVAK